MRHPTGIASSATLLCTLAILAVPSVSADEFYPAPSASTVVDGAYTVTYELCENIAPPDIYCYFSVLEEKVEPSGAWTEVASEGSIAFTSKPEGSYSYRVYASVFSAIVGPMEGYSAEINVVVSYGPPPPAPFREDIPTQMTYEYAVRQGDINSDGRIDLFVKKITGGTPLNGVVEEVMLQQASSGTAFSMVVPTAGQSAIAAGWPMSSASVALQDINVDGYVDASVIGVASAVGASIPNQIVFAPGQLSAAQPLGIRAVDTSIVQFAENSLDYFVNQDYFLNNVPIYFYQVWIWYAYCVPYGYAGLDYYYWNFFGGCYVDYIYLYGYYADWSVFNTEAVAIFANEWQVENQSISQEAGLQSIEAAIESLLGVAIGGWPMEELLGATGEHTDSAIRRGLEIFMVILGISRAHAQEVQPDEAPAQIDNGLSCIRVRSRYVVGTWPTSRHASLSYISGVPDSLLSAYDTVPNPFFDGYLISLRDYADDHPLTTMSVSIVAPPSGTPCDFATDQAYWQLLLSADDNYDDDLPYDKNGTPGEGYNSNGFVNGILNATGGTPVDGISTLDRMWGWDNPVPVSEFQ